MASLEWQWLRSLRLSVRQWGAAGRAGQWRETLWVPVLAPPPTGWVTLGKFISFLGLSELFTQSIYISRGPAMCWILPGTGDRRVWVRTIRCGCAVQGNS